MSLVQTLSADSIRNHQHITADHRSLTKRKLDDFDPAYDDEDRSIADIVPVKMKRDGPNAVDSSSNNHSPTSTSSVFDARLMSSKCSSLAEPSRNPPSTLQFFVRLLSEGNTIVIQAKPDATVEWLHEYICEVTGIPMMEQRLLYGGKQLQREQSLAHYKIQNDAGLQLVARMRSTTSPRTWQVLGDMILLIFRLCRGEHVHNASTLIKTGLSEFIQMILQDDEDDNVRCSSHLQIFMTSSAPTALVMLYMSTLNSNKLYADIAIRHFLAASRSELPKLLHTQCAPIVLEFCKLLRKISHEDPLYLSCRSDFGSMLESLGIPLGCNNSRNIKELISLPELYPFVRELTTRLSKHLASSMEAPTSVGPLLSDVHDFTAYLIPFRNAIVDQVGYEWPIALPLHEEDYIFQGLEIKFLYDIFLELLTEIDTCLQKMESRLAVKGNWEAVIVFPGWSQYLAILKELNSISKLYKGAERRLWNVLMLRKVSVCALVTRYAKRTEDHQWLLEHKDVTDFESRRHLAMMMFPEVKEDYEELHEMLIDRSQLLAESFEYIVHADPEALRGGLFMEFKNEEATGPGVLREWFFLVCQALFDPQNALFVACPNDRRRFYPNPASKVDPMHLDYFSFSGRVIALALMHEVQVGIIFDRVFFLRLAGLCVSLEDIKDADPYLYNSCNQILNMDAEFIDSDALGLTFVREVEELGSRKIVELCPGGKTKVVNSENRQEYVDLLIQHRFVLSISEQVCHFAQGFTDILSNSKLRKFFFQSLEHEDLDRMLHGSELPIRVEDWKSHTEYKGFTETDPQIIWFWQIVENMSADQKRVLLFFWTSVKYLPVEGFCGLASRLYIYKSSEPHDRLPSSHTCFYRLCFPAYPSMYVMQDRIGIITREHVGCSFGTW